jgi:hypothetical protein
MNSRAGAIPDRNSWLKATIVHAEAKSVAATDRQRIVPLLRPIGTNSAFASCTAKSCRAIAMQVGSEVGVTHIDAVLEHGDSWGFPNQGFLYSLAEPAFG